MRVAIALFTRDLRVHDNPVLHAAVEAHLVGACLLADSDQIRCGVKGIAARESAEPG